MDKADKHLVNPQNTIEILKKFDVHFQKKFGNIVLWYIFKEQFGNVVFARKQNIGANRKALRSAKDRVLSAFAELR